MCGDPPTDKRDRRSAATRQVLPAHLEIMLAMGDVEEARVARDELRELAHAFDSDALRAVVAQAEARSPLLRPCAGGARPAAVCIRAVGATRSTG